ncbi:MAG: Crp/Fnr family transcriptional regulator [Arcobacter sp.]|nr:MAG: Crp/Fnr family transcriptional regulator [Arcobacter sp.]
MNLDAFSFVSTLNKEQKTYLIDNLKPINIPSGNILFYQGDICHDILLLTSGEVRLYIQAEATDEITLYTLKVGEQCIINTASTLSNTQAISSAITQTDITGYLLNEEVVKKLMHQNDDYQKYIFSLYTIRMGSLATLIEDIKFRRLDERILKWLQAQGTSNIIIKHEELANILGSSRVVISRTLKELEHKQKVKLSRGSIEVLS